MRPFSFLLLLTVFSYSYAAMEIEITGGAERPIRIAIERFSPLSSNTVDPAPIIARDLRNSGYFEPVIETQKGNANAATFARLQSSAADYLVSGMLQTRGPDSYVLQFRLYQVVQQRQLMGYSFPASSRQLRRVAHAISDLIYQQIIGQAGAFSSYIAYIARDQKNWQLHIADADGFNPAAVVESPQPLMSPAWSADGQNLAYVSFEEQQPAIYVQQVRNGQRQRIALGQGIHGAPSWDPKGRRLALTLSRDGHANIYLYDLDRQSTTQLTTSTAIDTEATWSADGKNLFFTSDRSGQPQIYRMAAQAGSRVQRLSFTGNYNASPAASSDGRLLAMVHRDPQGLYRIAVLDLQHENLRLLTDGPLDESPSFSPNDRMLLYATKRGAQHELGAVSVDGRITQALRIGKQAIQEPAWSPLQRLAIEPSRQP